MELLGIILSSAVISALVSYISNSQNNQLKYITSERSGWRKEIKDIAGNLVDCKKYKGKAKRLLQDLKLRINAYGRRPDSQYPEDICLDCFKDEHIWKEIDAIEKGEDFKEHRNRLNHYLGLLLKFDWERSKREAKAAKKCWGLGIVYLLVIIIYVVLKQNLSLISEENRIIDILEQEYIFVCFEILPLILVLVPNYRRYAGFIEEQKYFNRFVSILLWWSIGVAVAVLINECFGLLNKDWDCMILSLIEVLVLMPLLGIMFEEGVHFRDYSNAVKQCARGEFLNIYSPNGNHFFPFVMLLRAEIIFNNGGISYKEVSQLDQIIVQGQESMIRWRYRKFSYRIWKCKNGTRNEGEIKTYLSTHPKACKMLVKYKNEIIIGYKKKKWIELTEKIRNGQSENILIQ